MKIVDMKLFVKFPAHLDFYPRICIFVFLLVNFCSVKAVEVSCESVSEWSGRHTCDMDGTTAITSDNVKIADARNENIGILQFDDNSKIFFLPIEIYEKMPNVQVINAERCSISKIFKKNFVKLTKLAVLWLGNNKIEKIESDTFDNLVELEQVYLQYNRIKFINEKLFEKIPKLTEIDLRENVCINETSKPPQNVKTLLTKITALCGTDESNPLNLKCGIASYICSRIMGGCETVRGKWPFMVALIWDGNFFCGGNLISLKHVLTAAHCVHNKNQTKLEAKDVSVLLGRYDLNAKHETSSEHRNVTKILMHPNWRNDTDKYDSDLAILVLDSEVRFNEFIQPVCLPKDTSIMDHYDGTVVGWGKAESEAFHENIPREVSVRAVNTDICFDKDHNLGKIYSLTTFCAGGEGAGPCTGDSGGGFFVYFRGLWTLRGIVSSGAMINGGFSCDVDRFNLFTKLVDFLDWINETVELK